MEVAFFIIWHYLHGLECPCDTETPNNCIRYEVFGVQPNHFLLFTLLGMFFPEKFWFYTIVGILWEVYEYFLQRNPRYIREVLGGCLTPQPENPRPHVVYGGVPKYINPLDRWLGIPVDTDNTWHPSAAEAVLNVLGLLTGIFLRRLVIS